MDKDIEEKDTKEALSGKKDDNNETKEEVKESEDKEVSEKEAKDDNNEEETAGEASFKKGTNDKKGLIAAIVVIVAVALLLFSRTDAGKSILEPVGFGGSTAEPTVSEKYANPVHKYAFEFETDEHSKLVVAGSIPVELEMKNVKSMQDLNLTDGDALLIRTDAISGDNIVYTVLELSERVGYVTFDEYLEALRVNLDNTTQAADTEYTEEETEAGKDKFSAVEFSFEMDVLVDQEGLEKRVGVFHDTVFEAGEKAYSISFGYPKDIANAKYYINSYRDMVASFEIDVEIEDEDVSDDDSITEKEAETEAVE